MTATPEELILMLYDGAIKFMNIGKYSIENKDLEKAHTSLNKGTGHNTRVKLLSRYELRNIQRN